MAKKVVVGGCTYNVEDIIEDTLDSILNQTVKPDLFVICDKSTDKTPEILEDFKQKADFEVQILKQKGVGVGDALQDIYEYIKSRGGCDVLVIFETERGFAENWLETHLALREEFKGCDLVSIVNGPVGTYVAHSLKDPLYCWGADMSISLDALDRVGGWDRNMLRGEDWDLHIRLGTSGITPVVTDKPAHRLVWEGHEQLTLEKMKKRDTSLTFLAKYGLWYLIFHPAHFFSDIFTILFWVVVLILSPISLILMDSKLMLLNIFVVSMLLIIYFIFSVYYGRSYSIEVKRFVLYGISIPYAIKRLISRKYDWNLKGFTRKYDWNLESYRNGDAKSAR